MKKICLLACSFLLVSGVIAQPSSRLVGVGQYDYDNTSFSLQDSFTYQYSGGRGSNMKTGEYKFDTSAYTIAGQPIERNIQTFYYPSHELEMRITQQFVNGQWQNYAKYRYYYHAPGQYDSVVRESWNPFNQVWLRAGRSTYAYNTAQKPVYFEEDTWDNLTAYVPYRRIVYQYTGNALVNKTEEFWDAVNNNWVGSTQHIYQNDGNGRIIKDSMQVWDNTNMVYNHEYKTLYSYDGGGNVATMTEVDWDPVAMNTVSDYKHIYKYSTQNLLTNDSLFVWNTGTSSYDKSRLYLNTYDANSNLLQNEEQYIQNDTFRDYRRKQWTYNSFNQPMQYIAYEWDAANLAWKYLLGTDVLINYRYQSYDPTTINNVVAEENEMKLYPVPAGNIVSLALELDKPQEVSITIYDTRGAMLKQWHFMAGTQYNISLPVADIPAGQYVLQVQGVDKQMTQHLVIAR